MKRYILFLFVAFLPVSMIFAQAEVGACPIFPADNPWNIDISDTVKYPTHIRSDMYINSISTSGGRTYLHPDFGADSTYGIPYEVVGSSQPLVMMTYNQYGDESDLGPFPIPTGAMVEGGRSPNNNGDRHVLIVDTSRQKLYEFWQAVKDSDDDNWSSSNGATFDLAHNYYRPDGWTSADAAGLPIFPGLVRYDEVQAGIINHALRFTVEKSSQGWIFPARHEAGSTSDTTDYPPMGLRLRLNANFDLSSFTGAPLVILTALKKYGMIVADNGSAWFISGCNDTLWNDDSLAPIKTVPGSAFEVVDMGYTINTVIKIETGNDTLILPGDSLPSAETSVPENLAVVPALVLEQNAPNPFFATTQLSFTAPYNTSVSLSVYDVLGRKVATLYNEKSHGSDQFVTFNAAGFPAGSYIARLQSGGRVEERLMQVVR